MSIRFFRLKNGDDIVADCRVVESSEEDDLHYIIRNPLKLVYFETATRKIGVTFMSWIFPKICDYQTFKLYTTDVLTVGDISQYIEENYLKIIGVRDDADTEAVATATEEELQKSADEAVSGLFDEGDGEDFFSELNPGRKTVH